MKVRLCEVFQDWYKVPDDNKTVLRQIRAVSNLWYSWWTRQHSNPRSSRHRQCETAHAQKFQSSSSCPPVISKYPSLPLCRWRIKTDLDVVIWSLCEHRNYVLGMLILARAGNRSLWMERCNMRRMIMVGSWRGKGWCHTSPCINK